MPLTQTTGGVSQNCVKQLSDGRYGARGPGTPSWRLSRTGMTQTYGLLASLPGLDLLRMES